MKVVSVETNIKSPTGQAYKQELGDYNLLIGPNESGKSALAEAVQLALAGSAYGLFFRPKSIKNGAQLSRLAPKDSGGAFAQVEFDDGSTARWEAEVGKRAKRTGVAGVAVPIGELRAAITGSVTTAHKFFLPRLVSGIDRASFLSQESGFLEHLDIETLEGILPPEEAGTIIDPSWFLEWATTLGKQKRAYSAESKTKLPSNLSRARRSTEGEITDHLDQITKSIQFEFIKRHYGSFEGAERSVLSKLCGMIGAPSEIAQLKGSGVCWDDWSDLCEANILWDVSQAMREELHVAETACILCAALEKHLEHYIYELLAEPLQAYAERVNSFLPGDVFRIEDSPHRFVVGLERGGHLHTALSGSTEARVLAAMGAALATPEQPAVIVVDDRMWDTATLAKTMQALEKAPCQVIIMTTIKPRGRNRSKWTYIDIEKTEIPDAPQAEEVVEELTAAEVPENGAPDVFAQLLQ